jgi:AraC-like DNA-binding protein
MDALSTALRDVRITGAVLINAALTAPWGYSTPHTSAFASLLAPGSEHLALFHLVIAGQATARADGHEVTAEAGEIVVIPHGEAHELWHGATAERVDTMPLLPKLLSGDMVRERGGGGGPMTALLCGYFGCERYAARLFLAGLPPVFKIDVRRDAAVSWLVNAIQDAVEDVASGRAGRSAVLAKLAEALFLETLVHYMEDLPPGQTGWLAAARDEVVGIALACLHRDPARAWTLDELARAAGTSRTVLSDRFTRLLGEPPLAYLARWRLQLAARLLETTDEKILRVALDVGYESEAAFKRAFKRQFDVPPAHYRRRHHEERGSLASMRR